MNQKSNWWFGFLKRCFRTHFKAASIRKETKMRNLKMWLTNCLHLNIWNRDNGSNRGSCCKFIIHDSLAELRLARSIMTQNTEQKTKQWLKLCVRCGGSSSLKSQTQSVWNEPKHKTCSILSYYLWYMFHGNSNPEAIWCEQQFRIQPVGLLCYECRLLFS